MTSTRVLIIVAAAAAVTVAGCRKRVQPATPPPAPPPTVAEAPPAPPPPPPPAPSSPERAPLSEEEIFARKTLAELNAEAPLGDVFFDFDQSIIRDDARPTLQANAQWLLRRRTTRVTVEGHGDERGTAEYNLALGERRANAAKAYLTSLGVGAERILVVSKGEEAPFCSERSESCWQQNRRGHFIITAK